MHLLTATLGRTSFGRLGVLALAALLTMACAPGQIEQTTVAVVAGSPTCTTQPSGSRTVCNQPAGGVQQCWVQQYGGQVTCQPVTAATTTCVTPDVAAAAVK